MGVLQNRGRPRSLERGGELELGEAFGEAGEAGFEVGNRGTGFGHEGGGALATKSALARVALRFPSRPVGASRSFSRRAFSAAGSAGFGSER